MCGIAGYAVPAKHAVQAFALFERLMAECQVRGRHASGAAWASSGALRVVKAPRPFSELSAAPEWATMKVAKPTVALGHTRYSTSGDWQANENNQPLTNKTWAVAHNGLVSMADKPGLERQYGLKLRTGNDTEVLLQRVTKEPFKEAFRRVHEVDPPIFACGFLKASGELWAVRDHIRPLWFFCVPSLGMYGFASTKDIIKRATKGVRCDVWEAEPYRVYQVSAKGVVGKSRLEHATDAEVRFKRLPIEHKLMTRKKKPGAFDEGKQRDHRKNLRASFKQYCVASIASWEIDPNYALTNYLFRRFELSKSQEFWVCYLYAVFYHPGSVFYVMQEFPEFEKVDLGRLKKWHTANWRKLRYNTDRKYEKGHFVEMFESYRDLIGKQTPTAQEEFFARLLAQGKTNEERFRIVEAKLRELWHFGRYATYIYTEALHRCMGMPIKADTMFLKEAQSSRTGLAYVLGWDPEYVAEGKLTTEEWTRFLGEGDKLMHEIQREYPQLGMDNWFMESCLCAYKGYFRRTKGRYLGYYLDRMYDEIQQMAEVDITGGVEWEVLRQFRKEHIIEEYLGELATPQRLKVHKPYEHVLRDTGRMIGLAPIQRRGLL